MTTGLSPSDKHLVGVGASAAAGCEACTQSFTRAATEAAASGDAIRAAMAAGLDARERALRGMVRWLEESFPALPAQPTQPLPAMSSALIGVAAAVAVGSARALQGWLTAARAQGASEAHVRLAVEQGRSARRGAERAVDGVLESGEAAAPADCRRGAASSPCGCRETSCA